MARRSTRIILAIGASMLAVSTARADDVPLDGAFTILRDGREVGSLSFERTAAGWRATRSLDSDSRTGTAVVSEGKVEITFPRVAARGLIAALEDDSRPIALPAERVEIALDRGRFGEARLRGADGLAYAPVYARRSLADLSADAESFAGARDGDVAVAVVDPRRRAVFTRNGDLKIRTASIVKVAILGAVLERCARDGRAPTSWERGRIQPMIRQSDNDATTALWNSVGGAPAVQAFADHAGASGFWAFSGPQQWWGYSETTAPAMAWICEKLFAHDVLNDGLCDLATSEMESVVDWQRWGVSQGVPSGATVALKNGWYPEDESGVWRVNSIAAVRDEARGPGYAIAVLTRYPIGRGEGYGHDTAREVSRRVWDAMLARENAPPPAPEPPATPEPTAISTSEPAVSTPTPEDSLPLPTTTTTTPKHDDCAGLPFPIKWLERLFGRCR